MAKKKRKVRPNFKIHSSKGGKKDPLVTDVLFQPEFDINKKVTVTPKIRNLKVGKDDYREKERGVGLKIGDYSISGSRTKPTSQWVDSIPNKRTLEFAIDNLLGGKLIGSTSKQGKSKQGRMDFEIPISKMPIIKDLFGYKKKSKGGQIKRPKGVKIAQRGFGRAMKNGK
tara:strand:+ start:39 stop:548 length:510 start_codon:yes stop_codon:yes gene_type:complete